MERKEEKIHDTGEKNPTESSQASKNIQQEVEGQKNDKYQKPRSSFEGDNELDIGDNRVVTPPLVSSSTPATPPPSSSQIYIIDIIDKVYRKIIDRLTESASLILLAGNIEDKIDKELIMSVMQLIQFLPMDPTYECISETTYITRYILPMMQSIFDDYDKKIQLDFTFTEAADKSSAHASTFNGNPECIFTSFMHETDNGVNIGYGEVKPLKTANNHYLVNWHLVRLGMFGKKIIDQNKLGGSLSIHVVAPYIIYYITQLNADGLYTMIELFRI
ncbi:hypothetical protein G6F56_007788 [Rhizopus delemar]|nr:hypothetical protein G6F56_007788 [Rhizopus delemar]